MLGMVFCHSGTQKVGKFLLSFVLTSLSHTEKELLNLSFPHVLIVGTKADLCATAADSADNQTNSWQVDLKNFGSMVLRRAAQIMRRVLFLPVPMKNFLQIGMGSPSLPPSLPPSLSPSLSISLIPYTLTRFVIQSHLLLNQYQFPYQRPSQSLYQTNYLLQ